MQRTDVVISWNMGCGPRTQTTSVQISSRLNILSELVAEKFPSILALQESPDEGSLRNALGSNFGLLRTIDGVATAYDLRRWSCDVEDISDGRVPVIGLLPVTGGSALWIVNVHVPVIHNDEPSRQAFVRLRIRRKIETFRATDSERENVVAGDFNLPPFDQSIVMPDGLSASRSLPWIKAKSTGIDRRMFNATWGVLGQHLSACGTLYRSGPHIDGPWLAVDQIILTANLVRQINDVHVVEKIGAIQLRKVGAAGAPNSSIGSDHLPIVTTTLVG